MDQINLLRYENLKLILGEELVSFVKDVNILVVGAGGIGCELLKNLVMSGFSKITVIDLDTIDISNLNRQFLFKKIHVGKSKAHMAKEAVLEYNNRAEIESYNENIKDEKFSSDFFKKFDVILNALDNNETRKHVNRVCLAIDKILIDSGSTGYNGQVIPILNKQTLCYECEDKPIPKTFPVCTIRQTPEKAEHCIAWAKLVFDLLFGAENENNLLFDVKEEIKKHTIDTVDEEEYAYHVFNYFFYYEIKKQNELKSASLPSFISSSLNKRTPIPLSYAEVIKDNHTNEVPAGKLASQIVWTLKQCALKFTNSIKRMYSERKDLVGVSTFDKDDDLCMDFVTAASNLRMHNFHISRKSRWEVQSIAGSIIPAVSSTNAIVAGVQVMQLIHCIEYLMKRKMLKEDSCSKKYFLRDSKARHVWISKNVIGKYSNVMGKIIVPETLEEPKSSCFICQQKIIKIILHSLKKWTLKDFVQKILRDYIGTNNPMLDTSDRCIYDPDEQETDSKSKHHLSLEQWRITSGSILTVTDYTQGDFQCSLLVSEDESLFDEEKDSQLFLMEREESEKVEKEIKEKNNEVAEVVDDLSVENSGMGDTPVVYCEEFYHKKRHIDIEDEEKAKKSKRIKINNDISDKSVEKQEINQNLENEENESNQEFAEIQKEDKAKYRNSMEFKNEEDEELEIIDECEFHAIQQKKKLKNEVALQSNSNKIIDHSCIYID